jgi:hypothetical protein
MKIKLLFLLSIILIGSSGCTAVDNFVDRHSSLFKDYEYGLHGGTGGSSGSSHSH